MIYSNYSEPRVPQRQNGCFISVVDVLDYYLNIFDVLDHYNNVKNAARLPLLPFVLRCENNNSSLQEVQTPDI